MSAIRALLIAAICSTVFAAQIPAQKKDVTVASVQLVHHDFTNDLGHIDKLWMPIPSGTLFHKWLSQAINDKVVITRTAHPETCGDRKNVRLLFLQDELLGALNALTFETDDSVTARRFDFCDDAIVSIVIQIK